MKVALEKMNSHDIEMASSHARDSFLMSGRISENVRPEIALSWRRSVMCGLRPENYNPVLDPCEGPTDEAAERLLHLASPVLSGLSTRFSGMPITLLLADAAGRLVGRWVTEQGMLMEMDRLGIAPGVSFAEEAVGTSAVGTAIERGEPTQIEGREHFVDALVSLSCAGAPIYNPITGRLCGTFNVTCRTVDSHPLLLSTAIDAGRNIETELLQSSSSRERALLREYLAVRRRSNQRIVALNEDTIIASASATRLIGEVDQHQLWEQARDQRCSGNPDPYVMEIDNLPSMTILCRPIELTDGEQGFVLEMLPFRGSRQEQLQPLSEPLEISSGTGLVGNSVAWRKAVSRIRNLRDSPSVLITGEPGVGKRVLALAACAALDTDAEPEVIDMFDMFAEEDETAPILRARLRAALLRQDTPVVLLHVHVLEDGSAHPLARTIDAAIRRASTKLVLTATAQSRPGGASYLDGLETLEVEIPPLRHRSADIRDLIHVLTNRFVASDKPIPRWSPEAIQLLQRLPYPGNVRELGKIVKAVLDGYLAGEIRVDDLPAQVRSQASRRQLTPIERAECDAILKALGECGGNKLETADHLGLARSTLYRKMRLYGLEVDRRTF